MLLLTKQTVFYPKACPNKIAVDLRTLEDCLIQMISSSRVAIQTNGKIQGSTHGNVFIFPSIIYVMLTIHCPTQILPNSWFLQPTLRSVIHFLVK